MPKIIKRKKDDVPVYDRDTGKEWPNREAWEASDDYKQAMKDTIDPRGFIHKDIQILRKHLPRLGYAKGDTLEDIAYRQGQTDMIDHIERYIIRGK